MQTTVVFCLLFGFITLFESAKARSLEDIDLEPEEEECILELDLDRKQIARMRLEDITTDDNSKYNNFTSCFWKKMGWQLQNGDIDYSNLENSLQELIMNDMADESPEDKKKILKVISKGVRKCQRNPPLVGNTHGQTAVRVQNCVMNEYYRLVTKAKVYEAYDE